MPGQPNHPLGRYCWRLHHERFLSCSFAQHDAAGLGIDPDSIWSSGSDVYEAQRRGYRYEDEKCKWSPSLGSRGNGDDTSRAGIVLVK